MLTTNHNLPTAAVDRGPAEEESSYLPGYLFEPVYANEFYTYMLSIESETQPVPTSIDAQPELNWEMRPVLVDFLIDIHEQFQLKQETLFLAVNIMDRYTSRRVLYKKHYQLLGVTALWMSAKYGDVKERLPTTRELAFMCCHCYVESEFIHMERHILRTLEYSMSHPTPEHFLGIFTHAMAMKRSSGNNPTEPVSNTDNRSDACLQQKRQSTLYMARYLTEITIFHRSFLIYPSSLIATAAIYFAEFIMGNFPPETDPKSELLQCVQLMELSLPTVSPTLLKKYAHPKRLYTSICVRKWLDSGNRFWLPNPFALDPPGINTRQLLARRLSVSSGRDIWQQDLPGSPVTPNSLGVHDANLTMGHGVRAPPTPITPTIKNPCLAVPPPGYLPNSNTSYPLSKLQYISQTFPTPPPTSDLPPLP